MEKCYHAIEFAGLKAVAWEDHGKLQGLNILGFNKLSREFYKGEDYNKVSDEQAHRIVRVLEGEGYDENLSKTIIDTERQLVEYFEGSRRTFDIEIDYSIFGEEGSFRRDVMVEMEKIPYGS